jgi:hypothetical protein
MMNYPGIFMEAEVSKEDEQRLHDKLLDPIFAVLETPSGRKKYISLGTEFLDANAEMLSKEYPTVKVVFPRKYVDRVAELFGWTHAELKELLKEILKPIKDASTYQTFLASPTNFVHAVAIFYSDMIFQRELRDSARQQMGLCMYNVTFNRQWPSGLQSIPVMAYTYSTLDNSWGLVRAENIINWIGQTMDGVYEHHRTRLSLKMSLHVLADFVKDTRSRFQQNLRVLSQRYYANLDKANEVGGDLKGDEDYVTTSNTVTLRNNLMRLIKTGDKDYKTKGKLYTATAKLKNVKVDDLYDLAQKVKHKDISMIMDLIFYVFIVKENHSIDDINSSKYIGRITNLPTAIDRAIPGKPVILPMTTRYKYDSSIVKAYICLVATFILMKVNQVKHLKP